MSSADATLPTAGAAPIVQYVVIRKDVKWPLGAVAAQAAHAAVAAVWESRDEPHTIEYCAPGNIDGMHKVCLGIESREALEELSKKLADAGIKHKLWVEQPENIPVSLATAPAPKDAIASHFGGLKLLR